MANLAKDAMSVADPKISFGAKLGRKPRWSTPAVLVLLVYLLGALPCTGAEVVLIKVKSENPNNLSQVEQACRFYGVNLKILEVSDSADGRRAVFEIGRNATVAVVLTVQASREIKPRLLSKVMQRRGHGEVPVLLVGVAAAEDSIALTEWSGGLVRNCGHLSLGFRPSTLKVGSDRELAGTLGGKELPAVSSPACRLEAGSEPGVGYLLVAEGQSERAPVLLRTTGNGLSLFVVPELNEFDHAWVGNATGTVKAFSSLLPFLMFVRYAAGDFGWHTVKPFANLTIDDAWLRSSYGHLEYGALLQHMQEHNFHTTVAFVPWNFDRSDPQVVGLIRSHPDRFSICVHGNNHIHREFGAYSLTSLKQQIEDIKQGVARMERFTVLTGIPYDRVMVFPHAVAPESTFAALKQYDFQSTANSQYVPLHSTYPADALFLLRPFTIRFANFLSLGRHEVTGSVPYLEIAINGFLGNPLLYYGHEDLFDAGSGAFDQIADYVNRTLPEASWAGLGEISRNLYLLRLRDDGAFDVAMFSNELSLTNVSSDAATFYIERNESFSQAIRSVTVDGDAYPFATSSHSVVMQLRIPASKTLNIRIAYQNDLDLAATDISKSNLRASLLRRVSDFRDLYLSKSKLGRAMAGFYYRHGLDSTELAAERNWLLILLLLGILFLGVAFLIRTWGKRRPSVPPDSLQVTTHRST